MHRSSATILCCPCCVQVAELLGGLTEAVKQDPPISSADAIAIVKREAEEHKLDAADVVRVCWLALMQSMNLAGKNQQQILQVCMCVCVPLSFAYAGTVVMQNSFSPPHSLPFQRPYPTPSPLLHHGTEHCGTDQEVPQAAVHVGLEWQARAAVARHSPVPLL